MHRQHDQPVPEEGGGDTWGFNQHPTGKGDDEHHPGGDVPSASRSRPGPEHAGLARCRFHPSNVLLELQKCPGVQAIPGALGWRGWSEAGRVTKSPAASVGQGWPDPAD